jgi:hypothetical protein
MRRSINLSGTWRVALDPRNEGISRRWWRRTFDKRIHLPGTTDEARMGEFADEHCEDRLSRVWRWIGPAWYQRTVTILSSWRGKHIELFLERTKDSQVWVDDAWVGADDSLSTPHVFDLSRHLTPGRHRLTVLIDNAKLPPVGPCHQVDERTQTNWNGIVGRIELRAHDPLCVCDIHVYPQSSGSALRVVTTLGNMLDAAVDCRLNFDIQRVGGTSPLRFKSRSAVVHCNPGRTTAEHVLKLTGDVPTWDEFDTSLLRVTVHAHVRLGRRSMRDSHTITTGIRRFGTRGSQFVVNGRPTFLRGKLDCALFPLTGYAPMDKKEWRRLLGIAQRYGINHYRFHSWCPPEAAFAAADELGIYLLAELPNKRGLTEPGSRSYSPPKEAYETLDELVGDAGPPAVRTSYLTREGERILRAYGNHPSFVMMTLGNELGGDENLMRGMCDHFRALDPRRLYAMGSGHFHWDIRQREGDDFWVTRATSPQRIVRGASWEKECHIDHRPPSTTVDYREALRGVSVPVVAHEIAEFEVYPDYTEIEKYTGVVRARNFEIFRERLRKAGMLDQAVDFLKASGALSVICHREDIEAALRTPGFGGFHLLDLQDFSGQGTALVGMLNVFMQSKGLITPAAWREFCCETVPLLAMDKYTWTSDEVFRAKIRVAHYGPRDLPRQAMTWQLRDGRKLLAEGKTRPQRIATGAVAELGGLSVRLAQVQKATKLVCHLRLDGSAYRNRYDLWVYPAKLPPTSCDDVLVTRSWTSKVRQRLADGASVLLLPPPQRINRSTAMAFQTGFWSPMFRNKPGRLNPLGKETPGTQGILCDPGHAMFDEFPTEFHSNWQWWQLVKNSRAMILDGTPRAFRPLVQVIDGIERNHKLGLIFEARVGKGRLLMCSIDLPGLQQHPEARQLWWCVQRYVAGTDFHPNRRLEASVIDALMNSPMH